MNTWINNVLSFLRLRCQRALSGALASAAVVAGFAAPVDAGAWVEGHYHKIRLIDGGGAVAAQRPDLARDNARIFGIEIQMQPKWKTYWSNPGESGGVPPLFSASLSQNVREFEVLLPVPQRLKDAYGIALGYKDRVVFPVRVVPSTPDRPVRLNVVAQYGVCFDICIPVELTLKATFDPKRQRSTLDAGLILDSLRVVPKAVPVAARLDDRPVLVAARAELSGAAPNMTFDVRYPNGATGVDLFLELDGINIPIPKRVTKAQSAGANDIVRFRVDLAKITKPERLVGKDIRVTMRRDGASSVTTWRVPPRS